MERLDNIEQGTLPAIETELIPIARYLAAPSMRKTFFQAEGKFRRFRGGKTAPGADRSGVVRVLASAFSILCRYCLSKAVAPYSLLGKKGTRLRGFAEITAPSREHLSPVKGEEEGSTILGQLPTFLDGAISQQNRSYMEVTLNTKDHNIRAINLANTRHACLLSAAFVFTSLGVLVQESIGKKHGIIAFLGEYGRFRLSMGGHPKFL